MNVWHISALHEDEVRLVITVEEEDVAMNVLRFMLPAIPEIRVTRA